jgi:integrase
VTLAEFFEGWRERYAHQVRASSFERKMQAVPHVRPFMGLYVDQVRAADVEDGIAGVAKRSPRQAQLALAALKQMLRNAQERGHVVDDAVLRIKPPRVEEREPRFLSWSEVEELAAACIEDRLIMLACLTGLRQGELFALRDSDVDFEAGAVVVTRAAHRGTAVRTKTRQSVRRAYLSGLAKQAIREQLLARKPNEGRLIFPSPSAAFGSGITSWRACSGRR